MICIELNTQVRTIIETAIKEARPLWCGMLYNNTEPFPRIPVFLEPEDIQDAYFNANELIWGPAQQEQILDICLISKTQTGPSIPRAWGHITVDGKPGPARLQKGERIAIAVGNLRFVGKIS